VARLRVLPLPASRDAEPYLLVLDRVAPDEAEAFGDTLTHWSKPDGCAGMVVFESSDVDLS
jgi:hypothetical protein